MRVFFRDFIASLEIGLGVDILSMYVGQLPKASKQAN